MIICLNSGKEVSVLILKLIELTLKSFQVLSFYLKILQLNLLFLNQISLLCVLKFKLLYQIMQVIFFIDFRSVHRVLLLFILQLWRNRLVYFIIFFVGLKILVIALCEFFWFKHSCGYHFILLFYSV